VSHPKAADITALLLALTEANIDFIVVGGVAGVLHGSSLQTKDLDIVHRRDPANVDRLLLLLTRLDAHHRNDLGNRRLTLTREMLLGSGQINLATTLGPLDPLCELGPGQGYEQLLPHTVVVEDENMRIRVLDLPTLIDVKSRVGRPKDKLAIAHLVALLEEKQGNEPV